MNSEIFIPYDDNNLEHVLNGPDYGQVDGLSAWNEMNSDEYEDYILHIEELILKFPLFKISSFSTTQNIK